MALRKRSQNCLRNMIYGFGVWWEKEADYPITRERVAQFTKEEVAGFYMSGAKTVANIEEWLAEEGLSFLK